MSLREEIYNLTLAYGEYVNDWEREQMTDKILNLFEKRIDVLIQECKDKEGKQYPIAVNYRIQPLLELKEVLK